jgi:hypothetical protein
MRITNKKLQNLIKEEKKSARMYSSYGFNGIAKQERSHMNLLKKKLERKKK